MTALPPPLLRDLSEALLDFTTQDALQAWLAAQMSGESLATH